MKDARDSLSRIRHVTETVDSAAIPICEFLEKLNGFLSNHNPAVAVWLRQPVCQGNVKIKKDKQIAGTYFLGYSKDEQGNWKICVRCTIPKLDPKGVELNEVEVFSITPLTSTSREVKLSAIQHIDELLAELAEKGEKQLEPAMAQVDRAKAALEKLKKLPL